MQLRGQTESITREVIAAIAAALVLAAIGAVGKFLDEPLFWAVVAIALAALTGVLATAYVRLRRRVERGDGTEGEVSADPRVAGRAPGGRFLIGMDVGRSRVSFGVLEVNATDHSRIPPLDDGDYKEIAEGEFASRIEEELPYRQLAEAIAELCRSLNSLDGIGIGVPGQVDVARGCLADSPGAFRPGEEFVANLASACAQHKDIRRALDVDANVVSDDDSARRAIAGRILVDNDVRSATRFIQSKFPHWENFACVFVGSGVGSGLVLDGALYYGAQGSAGEAGHMTLHLTPAQHRVDSGSKGGTSIEPGLAFDPGSCACGRSGVHWEALVNGPALSKLAHQTNPPLAARLHESLRDPAREDSATLSAEELGAAAWHLEKRGPLPSIGELPEPAKALLRDQDMADFVRLVVRRYAYLFSVGIANLATLLNLDHVALGGGVMDGMAPLTGFRHEWDQTMQRHALGTPYKTLAPFFHQEGGRGQSAERNPGWAWKGGALLYWDPSYHSFRLRGSRQAAPQ